MIDCSLCQGQRHVFDPHSGKWQRCICLVREMKNERCSKARIPSEYWNSSLETIHTQTVEGRNAVDGFLSLTRNWKTETPPSGRLLLIGKPAQVRFVGMLVLKAALYRYNGVWACIDELADSFFKDKELFRKAMSARVLVLQVGSEYTQQSHRGVLYQFLTDRDDPRYMTVVTSTVPPRELEKRYGFNQLWHDVTRHLFLPAEDFALA